MGLKSSFLFYWTSQKVFDRCSDYGDALDYKSTLPRGPWKHLKHIHFNLFNQNPKNNSNFKFQTFSTETGGQKSVKLIMIYCAALMKILFSPPRTKKNFI